MRNKKGNVSIGVTITLLLLVVALTGLGTWAFTTGKINMGDTAPAVQQPNIVYVNQPIATPNAVADTGSAYAVPVEKLTATTKNKYTQADSTTGNVSFYSVGADVADPNVNPMDLFTPGGTSTASKIQTNTDYDIYYDAEGATYYDEKITSAKINMNPETGTGYVVVDGLSYIPITAVGGFNNVDTLPEVVTGIMQNDTAVDTINYTETTLAGSAWFKMDLGNANANAEIYNYVLCFDDSDSDMEGDELTAFTSTFVSGSERIKVPNSLLTLWKDAMGGGGASCVEIADKVGSGEKARWEFDFTADETNWAAGEEFEIRQDDMGGYLNKQYPSRNAKATAETLTVGNAD